MTTIAFRNGIMAADSMGVQNGTMRLGAAFPKIWRLKDGTLVGGCGDYHTISAAVSGATAAMEIKPLQPHDATEILCLRPDLGALHHHKGIWTDLGRLEFYAIGSGSMAALGALHQGATAHEAIMVAAKLDVFTDNRVQTLAFAGSAQMPIQPDPPKRRRMFAGWRR